MTRINRAHRAAVAWGIAALLLGVPGCGSGPDSLLSDQAALQTEAATILDSIQDDATADKAIAKLDDLGKRAKANDDKLIELKLSKEELTKLIEKHRSESETAKKKLVDSMAKAMQKVPKKGADIAKATMPVQLAGTTPILKGVFDNISKGVSPLSNPRMPTRNGRKNHE